MLKFFQDKGALIRYNSSPMTAGEPGAQRDQSSHQDHRVGKWKCTCLSSLMRLAHNLHYKDWMMIRDNRHSEKVLLVLNPYLKC